MAAPAPQQTDVPPAYSEKEQEALGERQVPVQQPGGQLPLGQYPPQALPQTWPQGYLMPQVVGQTPITMAAAPPPDRPAPHDFLMLALVTTIICGILNLLSLAFGIPAIVLAALSMSAKSSKNYPQAKRYGRNALVLTILNIIFTMILSLLIIGLVTGYSCAEYSRSYSYSSYIYEGRCRYS